MLRRHLGKLVGELEGVVEEGEKVARRRKGKLGKGKGATEGEREESEKVGVVRKRAGFLKGGLGAGVWV